MTSKEIIKKSDELKKSIPNLNKELEILNKTKDQLTSTLKKIDEDISDLKKELIPLQKKIEEFTDNPLKALPKWEKYFINIGAFGGAFGFYILWLLKNGSRAHPIAWIIGLIIALLCAFALRWYSLYTAKTNVVASEDSVGWEKTFMKSITPIEKKMEPINKKIDDKESEKDDLSSKESVCNEKITQIQSKIDRLKKQISNLEKTNNFVVIYDKDDNGLLDIAETTNIDKLLSKHQKNIREIEKAENTSFIPDLVKVNTYLNDYQNNLVEEFKSVNNSYSEDTDVDSKTKKFTEDFEMYKVLISTLVLMIDSIVKDNHILYFKLKDSMDKYGVYDSNFQKNQITLMKENIQATSKLIKETKSSKDAIIESLESIDVALGGVQEELWNINMR